MNAANLITLATKKEQTISIIHLTCNSKQDNNNLEELLYLECHEKK
jgi:hypothetical protein